MRILTNLFPLAFVGSVLLIAAQAIQAVAKLLQEIGG